MCDTIGTLHYLPSREREQMPANWGSNGGQPEPRLTIGKPMREKVSCSDTFWVLLDLAGSLREHLRFAAKAKEVRKARVVRGHKDHLEPWATFGGCSLSLRLLTSGDAETHLGGTTRRTSSRSISVDVDVDVDVVSSSPGACCRCCCCMATASSKRSGRL